MGGSIHVFACLTGGQVVGSKCVPPGDDHVPGTVR